MPRDPNFAGAPPGRPHPDDPLELVGVALPADEESVREMAWTFAEEYAALGFDEERLWKLFRSPRYAGAHRAWQLLGDREVGRIVEESVGLFGRVRFVTRERGLENGSEDGRRRRLPIAGPPGGPQET